MAKAGVNEDRIKDMLFKQVEKPKGMVDFKAINVFENRYRVNLWVQYEEEGLKRFKIGASYFVVIDGDELRIKS